MGGKREKEGQVFDKFFFWSYYSFIWMSLPVHMNTVYKINELHKKYDRKNKIMMELLQIDKIV